MSPSDESVDARTRLQDVAIVRSNGAAGETGWRADVIYRWHGQVVEVWLGPSAIDDHGPPACQLRQAGHEVAFLDMGSERRLERRTGTVLGELISFEQRDPGILPSQRSIDIRLAVKQQLDLHKRWSSSYLHRDDHTSVAVYNGAKLRLDADSSHAEILTSMLVHASGILCHLDPPISWLRTNGQYRPR